MFSTHLSMLSKIVSQEMESVQVWVMEVSTVVSCGSTGAGLPSGMGSVMYWSLSPVFSGCVCSRPQAAQDSSKRIARNRKAICLHLVFTLLLLLDAAVAARHAEGQ